MTTIRQPVLSGSWYPAEARVLASTIQDFLAGAHPQDAPRNRPLLAVVPHAGYAYSGSAAGRLYGLLSGLDYDRIFILAPSHRIQLPRIALSSATAFATPLGTVPTDVATIAGLAADGTFEINDAAHADEHAVEIQLPFLQEVFDPETPIVPMLVSALPAGLRRAAHEALAPFCDGRSLFVVSTDFTHYGAAFGYVPFSQNIPTELEKLDLGAVECILAGDPEKLLSYGDETGITMCGLHATALALGACRTAGIPSDNASLITYCRSADEQGEYSHSVSYASVLLTMATETTGSLSSAEKRFLAALARDVIAAVAADRKPPTPAEVAAGMDFTLSQNLREKRGVFVTLTRDGQLRGCIGYIEGIESLAAAVAANASSAAAHDPRFSPITPDELPQLHVEISALTPLRPVSGPDEIVIGRHGIVLRQGPSRSVFLPQVAPEQGWDLETTLTHLALKAGLPGKAWRHGAEFMVFEAEIFD